MTEEELWDIERVAEHFSVTVSGARTILSDHGVHIVKGYRPEEIRAIRRPGQGRRTDLEKSS